MKDFVLNFDKMYFLVGYFIIWYIVFVNDKFCYIVSCFFLYIWVKWIIVLKLRL